VSLSFGFLTKNIAFINLKAFKRFIY